MIKKWSQYLKENIKKHEFLFIGLLFTILVFGVLLILGTINSGYHLLDDHEFYARQANISKEGFWNFLKYSVKSDLSLRYRPLYIILRTIGIAVWGANTVYWSICKAVEIILTLLLLYVFARKKKVNIIFSAVFAFLILWGDQGEIWWRLGPQESFGMLLFAASLLVTYHLSKCNKWYNKSVFIILLSLLSMQKESFLVSVPWFFILLFACETDKFNVKVLCGFIKRHLIEIVFVAAVFLFDIYMLLFRVGIDKVSYAGFSSDLNWKFYVLQTLQNLAGECFPYLVAIAVVILISYIGYKKSLLNISCILQICACAYLFSAELLVHARSGMEDRYLLPWIVSVLYIIFILGYRFWEENPRIKVTIGGLVCLFVLIISKNMISEGIKFTIRGKELQECAEFVINNSSNSDRIVAVSRDGEVDYAFGVLMEYQYQYNNFAEIEEYEADLSQLKEADVLFGKAGQVFYRLEEEAGLDLEDYNFYQTSNYEIAVKK